MYRDGKGVNKDITKAIELFTKSATLGHADAQNNLAAIYLRGEDISQDINKAIYWYTKLAEKGNVEAQNILASIYKELGDNNKSAYWSNFAKRNEDIW